MKNLKLMAFVLGGALFSNAYAASDDSNAQPKQHPMPKAKLVRLANESRELALKLDALSKTQDRTVCSIDTDGLMVYTAGAYILQHRILESKYLLDRAVIRGRYTIDIGCYGQDEMEQIIKQIKEIRDEL